jgi:hypothetical protein
VSSSLSARNGLRPLGLVSRRFGGLLYTARLFSQNNAQQRAVDFKMAIVINEAQLTKLIHEMTHSGSGRADHLGEGFLADFRRDRLGPAFLAKMAIRRSTRASRFSVELKS